MFSLAPESSCYCLHRWSRSWRWIGVGVELRSSGCVTEIYPWSSGNWFGYHPRVLFVISWKSDRSRAGGTQKLARIIGIALAKELIFTGRRLTAEEALKIGLIHYAEADYDKTYEKSIDLAKQVLTKVKSKIKQYYKSPWRALLESNKPNEHWTTQLNMTWNLGWSLNENVTNTSWTPKIVSKV